MKYILIIVLAYFFPCANTSAQEVEMSTDSFDASAQIIYGAAFLAEMHYDSNKLDEQGIPQLLYQHLTLVGMVEPISDGIAQLEVVLLDMATNQVVLTKSYEYDSQSETSDNGTSYARNGDSFILGLGYLNPPLRGAYQYQFNILDTNGSTARTYKGTTLIQ